MEPIRNNTQYNTVMARIDELFFATDANTPQDDVRLHELAALSAVVEEYEQGLFQAPTPKVQQWRQP